MSNVVLLDDYRVGTLWQQYLHAKEACRKAPSEEAMLEAFRILYEWREANRRRQAS